MKGWGKKIDNLLNAMALALQYWWNATALADSGEHETAIKPLERKPVRKKRPSLDDLMTAITFAEAGLADAAREFLPMTGRKAKRARLELAGVRVWVGSVPVADSPLVGVKIWSGLVPVNG